MYYCFLKEDLDKLKDDDPLIIQKKYAERLGKLYIADLDGKKVTDESGNPVDLAGHRVLLRCTYDNMLVGFCALQDVGADFMETGLWDDELNRFLNTEDRIFLKSVHKGFTAVAGTENDYFLKTPMR